MDNLMVAFLCMLLPGAICLILAAGEVILNILSDVFPGLAKKEREEIERIEMWRN
jgi:hypothetical protein